MSKALDILHRDHINIARLMDLLDNEVRLLEKHRHANFKLVRDIMDYIMNYPDLYHHPREDLVFELLRHRDKRIEPVINRLLGDHKVMTDSAINLSALLEYASEKKDAQVIAESLRKYINLTRQHMDIEESRLFPCAKRVLTKKDWAEINRAFIYEDDPLFGKVIYQQYQHIFDSIVNADRGSDKS